MQFLNALSMPAEMQQSSDCLWDDCWFGAKVYSMFSSVSYEWPKASYSGEF
jgi:hypothetical protein